MSLKLPPVGRRLPPSVPSTIRRVNDSLGQALRRLGLSGRPDLVVAYSGGVDSAALLWALRERLGGRAGQLEAIHVDHRLRPDSADAARGAMEVTRRLGLRGRVVVVDCGEGGDVEARAREARYAALAEAAGGRPILTAHTADDQAETVLYRLGKGAGTLGVGGIRERVWLHGAEVVRPLLGVRRPDLEELVAHAGIPIVEDPTNATRAYARNRLRLDVLPALEAAVPGAAAGLSRAASLAQADEAYLQERADEVAATLREEGGWDARRLAEQPFALASRIVRAAVSEAGGAPPTHRQVEELLALGGRDGAIHLAGGWVAVNRSGLFRIEEGGRTPTRRVSTSEPSK